MLLKYSASAKRDACSILATAVTLKYRALFVLATQIKQSNFSYRERDERAIFWHTTLGKCISNFAPQFSLLPWEWIPVLDVLDDGHVFTLNNNKITRNMMRIVSRLEYAAFMRVVMVLLVLFRTSESCLSVYPFIVSHEWLCLFFSLPLRHS